MKTEITILKYFNIHRTYAYSIFFDNIIDIIYFMI